jgi:hypothetical protein
VFNNSIPGIHTVPILHNHVDATYEIDYSYYDTEYTV